MAEQRERLIVELEARVDAFNRDLTNAQRNQAQAIQGINGRLNRFSQANNQAGSSTLALRSSVLALTGAVVAGTAALGAFLTQSVGVARDFNQAISDLSAITGASGEQLDFLAQAAQRFGASTTLSATQAAEAFRLIASVQPQLLENEAALARVTQEAITLSEATGEDLTVAANTLGNSLNQFNVTADESTRFINVLAAGARLGSSALGDTAEALRNGGVAAAEAGLSFEETNAVIQTLASVGIRGSEAGTALRAVMVALERQSDTGLRPSVVGLNTALANLRARNLDTTEAVKIFGQEHFIAANVLIRNNEQLATLTTNLTNTTTAYDQQATRVDNLNGDLLGLSSAYEGLQIRLGDIITETFNLREGTQTLTEGIQEFIEAGGGIEDVRNFFIGLRRIVEDFVDTIGVYGDEWVRVFMNTSEGVQSLTNTFSDEVRIIEGFLSDLAEFAIRAFISIPANVEAAFSGAIAGIRLLINEAGLLLIGLVEQLQELPVVGEQISSAIGDSLQGFRTFLEEAAEAEEAEIEAIFARRDAAIQAAVDELEAKREIREIEREEEDERNEERVEREQETQERLNEVIGDAETQKRIETIRTARNTEENAGKEEDAITDKNSTTLSDTLSALQKSTQAASSSSDTVFRINQAASAAQTLISTPAAIMKAYEQLGPIGGSIAAVGIAAAGVSALNTIRSTVLGGGGTPSNPFSGDSGAGQGIAANEQFAEDSASLAVSTTASARGTTFGNAFTVSSSNSDALGEAIVNYLNDEIRSGRVELNT